MNSVFKRSKDSKKDKKKEKTGSSSKPKKEPKERGSRKVDSPAEEGPPARPPPTPPTADSGNSADFAAAIANKIEDEEGLVFTGELVNGRPVVKGGNIEKLVERLTYEKYNDTKFVKAFMLTFRSFTTPTELLELLIARFNLTTPDESTIKMIRLRVFNVLKSWLKGGYVDFKQDPALKERLESFIKNEMHPVMENPAVTLQKQIEQCEIAAEKEYEHIFSDNPPQPVIPIPITPANKSNILTYSPKELARQLTLIEYRLFAAINPSECVSQNWMSKQKEKLAPNILKMISRFNDVSCWLASEIVKCVDLPTRTQILKMAIDIAEECWAINNFNAVMEIISGLNSSSVFRLKATWGGLPKKSVAAFEDMHEKMSRDFSYKNSRAVLRTVNPPCIPYLGMYLTDLTFIEEGNPNLLPDGSINFIKRQRLSEVIAEIQTYQYTPYCLAEVSFVRDYILNAESLPEGQCYKLSQKREDKHGNPTVDSPDLPYGDLEVKSSYLFDKPDGDSIIYETKKEVSDGTVVPVIAATIVKLIERLTYHETNQDMNFLSAFLMTYQSFTSGVEILDLLDNRFNMPKPANPSKQQLSKFTSSCMFPIHLRIINLLKSWVTSYPEDFVYDEELQAKFLGLISSWAQQSSKLQATLDTVEKVFEKKMNDPLPTPECRFFGFLYGAEEAPEQAVYYKDKTLLDFDDETLSQQITLIEQNFFSSIRPREALCETFSDEEMQERAPNIWAMKQNYIQLNRWTCTQVLTQPTWQKQFSAVSVLVLTADKLLGNLNFSSAMGITAGLLHLKTELPQIFDWVPNVILEKYKELELLLKNTKRLRMLEKNDDQPTIPFIDLYTLQLSGLFKALSDVAGPGGSLINFEKRRKQWTIFTQLEKYQSRAYQYEYDGACGGFLYHAEIWTPEEIDEKIRGITCPPAPDCRPELIDLHRATKTSSDVDGDQDAFSDGATSPRSETDAEVLSTLSSYLQQIIKVDSSAFADLVQDARTSLAKDLLEDLTSYSERVRDEIAVMQTQLGVGTGGVPAAQRIVSRVFSEGSVLALKQMDTDGQVYGWQDEVVIFKVTEGEDTWLVHVTSHLDKSDISVALRLFTFFSELSNEEYKNAIIASDTTPEAQVILSTRGVRLFNYTGVEVC